MAVIHLGELSSLVQGLLSSHCHAPPPTVLNTESIPPPPSWLFRFRVLLNAELPQPFEASKLSGSILKADHYLSTESLAKCKIFLLICQCLQGGRNANSWLIPLSHVASRGYERNSFPFLSFNSVCL